MSWYRKDENGKTVKTSGNLIQRWNDRIFRTTHTIENNADYYEIDRAAKRYITGLTDYTEFQLHLNEPNATNKIYIRYLGQVLRLNRIDNSEIAIGALFNRLHIYTLDTSDGYIWMDSVLQPTPDTYHGVFTYAVQTFDASMIPAPKIGDTLIALDTNIPYEYDGTDWEINGEVIEPYNGWYWMIEFFPDYYFGNGKIVWNGETDAWNIYTANNPRPDENTIKTDKRNNTFYVNREALKEVIEMTLTQRVDHSQLSISPTFNTSLLTNESIIKLELNTEGNITYSYLPLTYILKSPNHDSDNITWLTYHYENFDYAIEITSTGYEQYTYKSVDKFVATDAELDEIVEGAWT